MSRKWTTLAAVVTAVTLTAAGLALADEKSPMHQLMEKVNAKSSAIKKATRTPVAYKKSFQDLSTNAEALIELGKQSRDMKDSADKAKKPLADWQKLADDFIAKTETYKGEVTGITADLKDLEKAKKAYAPVAASCTACHDVFRKEDD